jgi:PEP-CTERM motif-containing protein
MPECRATVAAVTVLLFAVSAGASHLDGYVMTFDDALGADPNLWSHTATTTFLDGGKRLGPFVSETVSFTGMDYLAGLPIRRTVYLGFDVILSGAWSGDSGNDHFIVVANGQTVLDETFSNIVANRQSYPVPGSPGRTGSTAVPISSPQSSGFSYHFALPFMLTPYDPPNCCTDVDVSFRGTGATWYLDNFVVSSTPIPEPSTALLLGMGLAALRAARGSARARC